MPKDITPEVLIKELGGAKFWSYIPGSKHLLTQANYLNKKSVLVMHTQSKKHQNNVKLHEAGDRATHGMLNLTPNINRDDTFTSDLMKALISSNIPFFKLEQEELKNFLEKYTKRTIPSSTTLMRSTEKVSKEVMDKIKEKLVGRFLFVAIDESPGSLGRPMCMVLAGPLYGEFLERPYLIDLVNLGATNNKTVQQFDNSALFKLLSDDLNYKLVRLFNTDGAPYCVKAVKSLKALYPNMIHCLSHQWPQPCHRAHQVFLPQGWQSHLRSLLRRSSLSVLAGEPSLLLPAKFPCLLSLS